jgi:hypothetical protein
LTGTHLDFDKSIVPVGMLADAVVIEEPVAVTELNTLGHGVHLVIS